MDRALHCVSGNDRTARLIGEQVDGVGGVGLGSTLTVEFVAVPLLD